MSKQGLVFFSLLMVAWSCAAQTGKIYVTTLNCYAFFGGGETTRDLGQPQSAPEYRQKAQNLVNLWPTNAPLIVALQEIGGSREALSLAQFAANRYGRSFKPVFVEGKDTFTHQDVGALVDVSQGWDVSGFPSRVSELDKDLSKHLVLRLTNATTALDICIVHLLRNIGKYGKLAQEDQARALKKWAENRLAKDPQANLIILGDFNENKHPGDTNAASALLVQPAGPMRDTFVLTDGKFKTHGSGKAYDRILVSAALENGAAGAKLETVFTQPHKNARGDAKKLFTDHFPVTAVLQVNPQK